MGALSFLTDSSVIRNKISHDVPFSPELCIENGWDHHHVIHVHRSSLKSCEVIKDFGDMVALIYEYYPISYLRFFTKKLLVLKSRSSSKSSEIDYIFFPVHTGYVSWSTLKATTSTQGALLEHTLRLRVSKLVNVLVGWFLRKKIIGAEKARFEEDLEIISEIDKARKKNFKENHQCLPTTEMLAVWFRK